MTDHHLKIAPRYMQGILSGRKRFEVRKWDRPYNVQDTLFLHEWDEETKSYTGINAGPFTIAYMTDFGTADGFVALGFEAELDYYLEDVRAHVTAFFSAKSVIAFIESYSWDQALGGDLQGMMAASQKTMAMALAALARIQETVSEEVWNTYLHDCPPLCLVNPITKEEVVQGITQAARTQGYTSVFTDDFLREIEERLFSIRIPTANIPTTTFPLHSNCPCFCSKP